MNVKWMVDGKSWLNGEDMLFNKILSYVLFIF